jgi:hypothetical protein
VLNIARVRKYITDNAVSQTSGSFQRFVFAFVLSYRAIGAHARVHARVALYGPMEVLENFSPKNIS